jgi:hypothetical protein
MERDTTVRRLKSLIVLNPPVGERGQNTCSPGVTDLRRLRSIKHAFASLPRYEPDIHRVMRQDVPLDAREPRVAQISFDSRDFCLK